MTLSDPYKYTTCIQRRFNVQYTWCVCRDIREFRFCPAFDFKGVRQHDGGAGFIFSDENYNLK